MVGRAPGGNLDVLNVDDIVESARAVKNAEHAGPLRLHRFGRRRRYAHAREVEVAPIGERLARFVGRR